MARSRFWDNLIPLKPGLSEEQLAGWTPGPPALQGLGCRTLADLRVAVADGVSLSADVYLPKVTGRYPAVVVFGAYTKELHTAGIPAGTNEVGSPPVFTDRGYAHVIVTRRGMGRSDGQMGGMFCEQDVADHEKVIAWAAAQPWCDGQVVMFGTSYYGCVQPMVAIRRPPALKAFFANEMCTDYFRHIIQFGGTPALAFLTLWTGANFTDAVVKLRLPPLLRAFLSRLLNSRFVRRLWWPAFQRRLPAIMRRLMANVPTRSVREEYANWILGGKTRDTCAIAPGPSAELAKIDIPFVTVQNLGQLNLHQFGSYDLFERASTPIGRKWLILGKPIFELPVYEWQLEALAFFDHVLRGTENGYAKQPAVRYWLDGPDAYAGAANFPIPGSTPVRFYPVSGAEDAEPHRLATGVPDGGSGHWAAVPLGATVVGGFDEVANQVLSFDAVFDRTTEFAGPVSANLTFSCNEIDSHVIARIGRVDTSGGYHLLSLGTISPARRRLDPARRTACEIVHDTGVREPLVPGLPVVLSFSLTPGPTRLQPGEKLRLEIASRTDLLLSDVAHEHCHFPLQVPPYFSYNTLHYGPETYIELHEVS